MEKLSIVTVTYNDAEGLEKTIQSVIQQKNTGANIEHVIIDGKSTDNTHDILDRYKTSLDIIISEPDDGIFDAMNKGLSAITGDSVVFMNAGDIFHPDFNLCRFILDNPIKEKAIFTYTLQQYNKIFYLRPSKKKQVFTASDFGHQGVFVPRRIYENIFYDTRYSIIADTIWMEKIWKTGNVVVSNEISAVFALGGTSTTFSYKNLRRFWVQPLNIKQRILYFIKFIIFHIIGKNNTYILLYSKKYDIIKNFTLLENKV
jgi:glycosyltransferase involved in cell wall biosynthesis